MLQSKTLLADIELNTGKCCHLNTLKNLLKQVGLRWKRFRQSLKNERDENLFQCFKAELSLLREASKNGEIDLFYFDETGFNLNPNMPYGWQPKGQQILLPAQRKKGWTVLGALNVETQKFHGHIYQGAANSATIIQFFEDLCTQITQKTIVILDNASIHKAQCVKDKQNEWKQKGLFLQFIPAYCPELNLIEILWKQIKHFWLEPQDYLSIDKLYQRIIEILNNYGTKYCVSFC